MIKIFSDTLSCISPAEARSLGLAYFPQIVIFGDESYRDDSEMDPIAFLKKLRTSSVLPKTSAPPPAYYVPVMSELAKNGDTALVISPTAQMSGTYRAATTAAEEVLQEFPKADIRVIDTGLVAGGLGAVVKQSLKWVDEGLDADTISARVLEMSGRERVFFLVDTLEYLYRGGRIGAAKALFGSLLQVKPILTVRDGHTEAFESERTQKRALARLKEIIMRDCPRDPSAHLCLMHGDAEELAKSLAGEFSAALGIPVENIPIYNLTPAILTHSGPGAIGISYFVAPGQTESSSVTTTAQS